MKYLYLILITYLVVSMKYDPSFVWVKESKKLVLYYTYNNQRKQKILL